MGDGMMAGKQEEAAEATDAPPVSGSEITSDLTDLSLHENRSQTVSGDSTIASETVSGSDGSVGEGSVTVGEPSGDIELTASGNIDPFERLRELGIFKQPKDPVEKFQIQTGDGFDPSRFDNRWQDNIDFMIERMNDGENTFFMLARAGSGKSVQCFQLAERFREAGGVTYMSLGSIVRNGQEMSALDGRDRNDILYDSAEKLGELRDFLKQRVAEVEEKKGAGIPVAPEEDVPPALVIIDEASVMGFNQQYMSPQNMRAIQTLTELRELGAKFVLIGHPSNDMETLKLNMTSWIKVVSNDPRGDASFLSIRPQTLLNNPETNNSVFEVRDANGSIMNGPFEIPPLMHRELSD